MQPQLRDLMLGKSLGTESLQAFRQACQDKHLNITILPSAPGNQKTNPAERGWQTIQRRMANMFLQQKPHQSNGWQYCLQQWSWIELAMGTMTDQHAR
jgi:hypothetical protein